MVEELENLYEPALFIYHAASLEGWRVFFGKNCLSPKVSNRRVVEIVYFCNNSKCNEVEDYVCCGILLADKEDVDNLSEEGSYQFHIDDCQWISCVIKLGSVLYKELEHSQGN